MDTAVRIDDTVFRAQTHAGCADLMEPVLGLMQHAGNASLCWHVIFEAAVTGVSQRSVEDFMGPDDGLSVGFRKPQVDVEEGQAQRILAVRKADTGVAVRSVFGQKM